jgi:Domain of unknown function (DUF4276)
VTRIKIIVEGQTEESFIEKVLAPALWHREIYLTPIILGVPGHKGGNVNYARVKKDILLHLRQDPAAYCSTMLDLYGLGGGFPGVPPPPNQTGHQKARIREQAIYQDIVASAPGTRADVRFYSYLQVHEYEGLLFATRMPSRGDSGSKPSRDSCIPSAMPSQALRTSTRIQTMLPPSESSGCIALTAR